MRNLVFAVLLSLPAAAFAGGPPWLCLPIDGVTEKTAPACAELLTKNLHGKLWNFEGNVSVKVASHEGQWYATFPIGKEVALSEVEAALKGSKLTVTRGSLRLFGHVILEIDPRKGSAKDIIAKLDEIKEVSISEAESREGKLLVTIDMPYPAEDSGKERGTVGWTSFRRSDLSTDTADRSPRTASELPSHEDLQTVVSKCGGNLQDLRWSQNFACRTLGGVTVKKTK